MSDLFLGLKRSRKAWEEIFSYLSAISLPLKRKNYLKQINMGDELMGVLCSKYSQIKFLKFKSFNDFLVPSGHQH